MRLELCGWQRPMSAYRVGVTTYRANASNSASSLGIKDHDEGRSASLSVYQTDNPGRGYEYVEDGRLVVDLVDLPIESRVAPLELAFLGES